MNRSIIWKGIISFVVIVGVGVALLVLVNYGQARARDVTRLNDMRVIRTGLESYFFYRQAYPAAVEQVVLGDGEAAVLCYHTTGLQRANDGCADIIVTVPHDPLAASGWAYHYASNGETYTLTFQLEGGESGLAPGQHQATPDGIE